MRPEDLLSARDLTREEFEAGVAWNRKHGIQLSHNKGAALAQIKMGATFARGQNSPAPSNVTPLPLQVAQITTPSRPHKVIGIADRYANASLKGPHESTYLTQMLESPDLAGHIILAYGPPGTGKTWAGCAYLLDHAQFDQSPQGWWTDAIYIRAGAVVDLLGADSTGEKQRRRDALSTKRLVMLDDISHQTSDAWKRWFTEFIDARYRRQLTTILATNMSEEGYQSEFPAAVLDRMAECAVFVHTQWPSFRSRDAV